MARRFRSDGSVELRAAPSVPVWCAAAIAMTLGLVAQSCVEKGDTNVNSSGTGGGGAGGAGGTGASSSTGGSAGGDASNCLGDTGASVDCATLPYAAESCDGGEPQGVQTCMTAQAKLRAGVVSDLFGCLSTLAPSAMQDPCSSSHTDGVKQCVAQSAGKACEAPDTAAICAEVNCDPDCAGHMNALTPATRTAFKSCFSDRTTSGADCGTAFNDCYPM